MRIRTKGEYVNTVGSGVLGTTSYQSKSPEFRNNSDALNWRPNWYSTFLSGTSPALTQTEWVGEQMNDVEVPNFRRRLADGEVLPVNPMSQVKSYTDGYATCRYAYRKLFSYGGETSRFYYARWYANGYSARHVPIVKTYDPPYAQMITEARAKLAAGFMDVLTTVSELHKTVEMIVGFKTRVKNALIKLLSDWRRARAGQKKVFRSVADAMADLSSFWLEYRFGWRILYYDYLSIIKVLDAYENDIIRRAYRVTRPLDTQEQVTVTTAGHENSVRVKRTSVWTATARAGTFGSLDIRGNLQIDPVTTAWELLPFSLVIDMFWNVGDSLAAFSPFSNVKEESLWTSLERRAFGLVDIEFVPPSNAEVMYLDVTRAPTTEIVHYERYPHSASFSVQSNVNLSFLKALDLGAISTVVLKGLSTRLLRHG